MTIRRATTADLEAIFGLCCEAHEIAAHSHVRIDTVKAKKVIGAYILAGFAYVVSDLSGVLLGDVTTAWYSDDATVATDLVFYVRPERRGAGVALMKKFIEWGKENADDISMSVSIGGEQMARTDQFYERMGFTRIGSNFLM